MKLQEEYDACFERWAEINGGGWQRWFDPSIPEDPEPLAHSSDIIAQMIDSGETHWDHPGWIRDLWSLLDDWAIAGKLIRVQLTAEWLLNTLPDAPIDGDIGDRLYLLSTGQFCEAFEGEHCFWPKQHEFYLSRLLWATAGLAQDLEAYL